MEALVLSGLGMKLATSSRPASGAEHVVSHYWECYKVTRGIWPEFHGKKVGVATLLVNRIYRNIAKRVKSIDPVPDAPDWPDVYSHFTPEQIPDVKKLNDPNICDEIDLDHFRAVTFQFVARLSVWRQAYGCCKQPVGTADAAGERRLRLPLGARCRQQQGRRQYQGG